MSDEHPAPPAASAIVFGSSRRFVLGCAAAAAALFLLGRSVSLPVGLLAVEVFVTILALFVFGSFKYQIHKNALTYGMALVIVATFCGVPATAFHRELAEQGWAAFLRHNVLSFHGLDQLVHADTMLFILGLTFFVAVIAQTRLLEQITFFLLRRNGGRVLPTVLAVTAVVALASGILGGVSMIGLTIRTLVIILTLAAAPTAAVRYAVMVCTVVTTVCGIWLAYGEPPNLIMRANLDPHLTNAFFLRYCAPAAIACFLVVAWNLRRKLGGRRVALAGLDVLDAQVATVRFMQAARHGEVLLPKEFVEDHAADLGEQLRPLLARMHRGEPLGLALVRTEVPAATRARLLGQFVSEELAADLDRHYVRLAAGDPPFATGTEAELAKALETWRQKRSRAARIGALALLPFVGALVWHGINHAVPLFLASLAGFAVALLGLAGFPRVRALALREARHEFAEYYFLFPLFLSITLLTKAGFFEQLQQLLHHGVAQAGHAAMALAQFFGCTLLSSILDNNVVADFGSRALHGLELGVLHLFALAQIAGYAVGGCWTHIGSAQSVVAFAFIRRDVDEHYTPVRWIKEMTPVVLESCAVLVLVILAESLLLRWLPEAGLAP
ncbi:MAG: hypothetical protein NTV49_00045 [Kiritimatiellaeota bacterium]|nr:hypothetical protein [Kiritimatiellota bacterium]